MIKRLGELESSLGEAQRREKELAEENRALRTEIEELKQAMDQLRAAKALAAPEDDQERAHLKKQVRQMMQEIDECLRLISD